MYYIYETQTRQDGVVNVVETVGRSTFANALAYFHERIAKMVVADFASVGIRLTDAEQNHIQNCHAFIHDGQVDMD